MKVTDLIGSMAAAYIIAFFLHASFDVTAFAILDTAVAYAFYLVAIGFLAWDAIKGNMRVKWWQALLVLVPGGYFFSRPQVIDLITSQPHIGLPLPLLLLVAIVINFVPQKREAG